MAMGKRFRAPSSKTFVVAVSLLLLLMTALQWQWRDEPGPRGFKQEVGGEFKYSKTAGGFLESLHGAGRQLEGLAFQRPAASLNGVSQATTEAKGYVLTLRFTGQQVAGVRGLFSQQCWLNAFGLRMSIVEPFVVESLVAHSKEVWKEEGSLRLSNLYNISSIPMASWDTFIATASRKLIVVNIGDIYSKDCMNFKRSSCTRKTRQSEPINASKCKSTSKIRDSISHLKKQGFKVVRDVCLSCSPGEMDKFTPSTVVDYIFGGYQPKEVTLLFSQWKFSFHITPDCAPQKCTESLKAIESPSHLEEDANRYTEVIDRLQNMTGNAATSRTTIGVIIRLEWFLIFRSKNLEACLHDVRTTVASLAENEELRIVLALDIGKFGSGTFNQTRQFNHMDLDYFENIVARMESFVSELYGGRLTFDVWEESFVTAAGGVTDRGYIAALQSEVVSKADCLLLIGGGHFQGMAVQKYRPSAGRNCIHPVCVPETFLKEYMYKL